MLKPLRQIAENRMVSLKRKTKIIENSINRHTRYTPGILIKYLPVPLFKILFPPLSLSLSQIRSIQIPNPRTVAIYSQTRTNTHTEGEKREIKGETALI